MNPLHALLLFVVLAEKVPEAKDVKAGWLAFGIFLLLIVATVFLCFNFLKQLRKAQAAKEAGAFGDQPVPDEPVEPVEPVESLESLEQVDTEAPGEER